MTGVLFLLAALGMVVLVLARNDDPTPDPAACVTTASHLSWLRLLGDEDFDKHTDQALSIGNSDEFADWEKELAA